MEPALTAALLWLVFGATHIGLATRRVRAALVAHLGEYGFAALFSLVASAAFAVAIAYFAAHRNEGAAGLALANVAPLRRALIALSVTGIVLVSAGSATYVGSPYDLFAARVRAPRGIERITRHPFFAGLALFALAHALIAPHLIGTVGFAGLALVPIIGARHQDAKLLARGGKAYADYLAATSAVPFAAILSGRQRLVWSELPLGAFAIGLVVAAVLRTVHGSIFANGGVWVIVSVVGGAAIFTWQSARRARRLGAAVAVHG